MGERLARAYALLEQDGVPVPEETRAALHRYVAWVRRWNPLAKLVSMGDVESLEETHLVDALSLVPLVRRFWRPGGHGLLDIGSGGGFPAIPIKLVLQHLPVTLVERSARKAGILDQAAASFHLVETHVVHGEFPGAVVEVDASVITARAVERPELVQPSLLPWLQRGAVFFDQTGGVGVWAKKFHVELWEDEWTTEGLRRGSLQVVTAV